MANPRKYFPKVLLFVQILSAVVSTFVILWLYMNGNVKLPSLSLVVAHDQDPSEGSNMGIVEPGLFQ